MTNCYFNIVVDQDMYARSHLSFSVAMDHSQAQSPHLLTAHAKGSKGAHMTGPQILHPISRDNVTALCYFCNKEQHQMLQTHYL